VSPAYTLDVSGTFGVRGTATFSSNTILNGELTLNTTTIALGASAGIGQGSNSVAIGTLAANTSQGYESVAIGNLAGQISQSYCNVAIGIGAGYNTQGQGAVAVGQAPGYTNQQPGAVAIGSYAGFNTQGAYAIAIGSGAAASGSTSQGSNAVAIGNTAAYTEQGVNSVAIGKDAAYTSQGADAVAIGHLAGSNTQGTNAIAIGNSAGYTSQSSNSIILNATGSALDTSVSGFIVAPVRSVTTAENPIMAYNTSTNEIITGGALTTTYSGSSPGLTISGTDTVGGAGFMNFLRVTNTSSGVTNPTKTFRINQVGALGIVNNAYDSEIFNVTDSGILQVGGGAAAAAINNSPTTNYLVFNNNRSSIYDDGNMHIHTMQDGGTMWINTSGGQISMISQTVSGASLGTGVGIGTSTLTAYVTISGSKTYTIGQYGYLHPTLGAGTGAGTTAPYSLATSERIQATEFDATSDERLKDISGGITAEEAIRFVQSVSGMYYSWKSDPSGGVHTGFIAQDIHKAGFNHMVSTIPNTSLSGQVDDDGYTHPEGAQLTLNYSAITPYHHEAIKVLLDRVAHLEAKLETLMSKL
jgi:hypothetical protein